MCCTAVACTPERQNDDLDATLPLTSIVSQVPGSRDTVWCMGIFPAGDYCAGAGERVNVVLGWIYARLSARRHAGGLAIDAPVLANVWARLADGYQAFEQCRCLPVVSAARIR